VSCHKQFAQSQTRRSPLKYKQTSFLLAIMLISAAPIFADNIPGDSKSESKGVSAQALTEKVDFHGLSALGDSGLSGVAENSDKTSGHGGMENAEENSGKPPVTADDSGSNDRDFSHLGKGKSHEEGDGDNPGGGGTPPPVTAVPESGSRLLLLIGLAGLGIFFLRRDSYQKASE
jgi:hypothetical protein